MKNCEKCALSLACHAGLLGEISICPLCDTLSIDEKRMNVICPKRLCNKYIKYRWMEYYFNRNRVVTQYQALNTVLGAADHGPKQHGNDQIPNILWIQLCRKCIGRLLTRNKKQAIKEVQNAMYTIDGIPYEL